MQAATTDDTMAKCDLTTGFVACIRLPWPFPWLARFKVRHPVEKFHVLQAKRPRREKEDRPQAVGVVARATKGASRLCVRGLTDTGHETNLFQAARIHH